MYTPEKSTVSLSKSLTKSLLRNYKPSSKIIPGIVKIIKTEKKFLLTTHISADADGLGSQIGLYYLLKKLHKDAVIVNNENVPGYLTEFVDSRLVQNIHSLLEMPGAVEKIFKGRYVLLLDSSELKRSEKVAETFTRLGNNFGSIDHHMLPNDKRFHVDSSYGATAEIIWDLYHAFKIPVPIAAAPALYAGLVADTGNFRYGKTSFRTHLMAGELLGMQIHSDYIYRTLYESQPPDRLHLIQRILSGVIIDKQKGFIAAEYTRDKHAGLDLGDSASEGIVNILLGVKNIRMAALITQTDENELKCSLRSTGDFDISSLAQKFGGGGHKNASGLKIRKQFNLAKDELLKAIEDHCS